jgi:hypothetical protein
MEIPQVQYISAKFIIEIIGVSITIGGALIGAVKLLMKAQSNMIEREIKESEKRIESHLEEVFHDFYLPLKQDIFELRKAVNDLSEIKK